MYYYVNLLYIIMVKALLLKNCLTIITNFTSQFLLYRLAQLLEILQLKEQEQHLLNWVFSLLCYNYVTMYKSSKNI